MKKINKAKFNLMVKSKAFKAGGYSLAAIAIVIVMAVLVNVLVNALPETATKLDNTSNQLFTISDQTKKLLSGLEDDVTLYWIVRDGYENDTISLLLDRYEDMSDHISVEKVDPDVYPSFAEKYTSSLTDNSIVAESGSKSRYIDYYDIYVYDYDYYTYMYYGTYDVSFNGESEITSAIDYVVNEELPKVYMIKGHGESDLSTTFETAVEKENIELSDLSLLTEESIPEDASCIIINSPTSDISANEKEVIEDYLLNGGKMILITSPLEDGDLANIKECMSYYGVEVQDGIVVEGNQNYYAWGMPYYLLADIGSHDITEPLISGGYYILLPLAQGLTVTQAQSDTVSVTELLSTSSSAFSKLAGYELTTYEKEDGDVDGPFALSVFITDDISDEEQTQILWISSGALLDDSVNEMVSGANQDFFLNALGFICDQDESSISIHSKSLSAEYLTVSSASASLLSILMVGIIPAIFLAVGVVIWIKRKRR